MPHWSHYNPLYDAPDVETGLLRDAPRPRRASRGEPDDAALGLMNAACWAIALAVLILLVAYAAGVVDLPDLPANAEIGGRAWKRCCARFGCGDPLSGPAIAALGYAPMPRAA